MKTGARTNGAASLNVSYSQMVPPSMRGHVREVSAVLCDQASRGKGYATALLEGVMREADAARVVLMVVVEPFDDAPMSKEQLRNWYAMNDFIEIQAEPCVMARQPQFRMSAI